MDKTASTEYPVIDLIRKRWSPRSFTRQQITKEDFNTILEAASWAASASNEQPWEYYYGFNGSSGFDKLHSCLSPGNQIWAKNASVLLAATARTIFAANKTENFWSVHDFGMANSNLLLQAVSMNIYGHPMDGFDKIKLIETINLVNI